MPISESIRKRVIDDLFKIESVKTCWPTWETHLRSHMVGGVSANKLLKDVGPGLSAVFSSTNTTGRNQSSQSAGGTAWEALVCWYLNICLIGTRAVVIKKNLHLPTPIRDALTVSYGTVKTNTESDLVAVTFPDDNILNNFSLNYSGKKKEALDEHISQLLGQIEACVIQCKTNWNDNAQIPMLWDMVYSATGFSGSRASVGTNGHSAKGLSRFAYAFVTVPTQKDLDGEYTKTSTSVLRVSNLSGGNYWGNPSKNGIAGSIADIFNRNFSTAILTLGLPWQNHLNGELASLSTKYSYFNL